MSLSDSDDDIEPGSSADSLLRRMARRAPAGDAAFSKKSCKVAHVPVPGSLEAILQGAGVTSPFNTWQLEESLRQQASSAVDRRHHEIEAFERALHGALVELYRVRAAEEARLAVRVGEATRRFHQQMEALQQQYLLEVEKLKRHTVVELHRQRSQSEAVIAARVRALQAELRYDRPAGLSPTPPAAAAAATAATAQRAPAARPSSSPLKRPLVGSVGGSVAGGGVLPAAAALAAAAAAAAAGPRPASSGTARPPAVTFRMRSAPNTRVVPDPGVGWGPGPGVEGATATAAAAAAVVRDGGSASGRHSPVAAAIHHSARTPDRVKFNTGEGVW